MEEKQIKKDEMYNVINLSSDKIIGCGRMLNHQNEIRAKFNYCITKDQISPIYQMKN